MMTTLMVSMVTAALCVNICSSITVTTTHNKEQEVLNALRNLSHPALSPAAKTSGSLCGHKERPTDGKFWRPGWRMCDWLHPQSPVRRQEVTSYNLNSYGLRYGKRQNAGG
ncbi:metastasis-suppressor KiSS-1 [Cheilinus undulatus]|uniref:metastasis-suppressor KiSS-1 n=1 Tax=Cheilinus undulatus TaxID=241271 RepID=UPI001BD559DD|nr:metastasis-suppressor KiSS-1 [Cheilinus undulatus]